MRDQLVGDSQYWNSLRGAVTWGNGTTGVRGIVSAANSLVGSTPNINGSTLGDQVGGTVMALANGNYLVVAPYWSFDDGAVTWGNGTTGVMGMVSSANSLVGSTSYDLVGGDPEDVSPGRRAQAPIPIRVGQMSRESR